MIDLKMKMRTESIFQVCSEFDGEKTYYVIDLNNWMNAVSTEELSDNELYKKMKPMDDEKILFVLTHYFEQFKEHPTVSKEIKEKVELTKNNLLEKVIGFKS